MINLKKFLTFCFIFLVVVIRASERVSSLSIGITISSANHQFFSVGQPPTPISPITIRMDSSFPRITATYDIRIKIPANFNMVWDTNNTHAIIEGKAEHKVSRDVAYEDGGKTLLINIEADFEAGDWFTIYGLSFKRFSAFSPANNLELEVYDDNLYLIKDDKIIFIGAPTISSMENQYFKIGDSPREISKITITDSPFFPVITADKDIRITIPEGLGMSWDISSAADVVITGTAVGKIRSIGFTCPYTTISNLYKVNLHGHTTNSDGSLTPTQYMELYRNWGYTAVAITDHDTVTADPGVSGIFYISGVENTAGGGHMNSINVSSYYSGTRQQQIDDALRQGGFTIIVHPNSGWTNDSIVALNDFKGIEIFNSLQGFGESYVDYALSQGKKVWCFASDDLHHSDQIGRGWINVNSALPPESITKSEILNQIINGNFYATARDDNTAEVAKFTEISVYGNTITAKTDRNVKFEFITNNGKISQTNSDVSSASYTVSPEDAYVRIKVTYIHDGKTSYLFSNPIFVRKAQSESISFEDNNRTLVIDVVEDFDAEDTIVISGLRFNNFNSLDTGRLSLSVNGSSAFATALDDKTITIQKIQESEQR
jgi:hypothetical protein